MECQHEDDSDGNSDAQAALHSVLQALRYAAYRVSLCEPGVRLSTSLLSLLSSVRDGQTELDAALTRLVMNASDS